MRAVTDDEGFRRRVYQAVSETIFLEPDDPRIVPLHQQRYGRASAAVDHDPVGDLSTTIQWSTSNSTMQLFSGFRGSGKTTELLRLREMLRTDGYAVLYVRLEEYLNVHEPIELGEFLIAVLAAIDDAAHGEGGDPHDSTPPLVSAKEPVLRWFDRLKAIITASSEQFELGVNLGLVEFKTELRENPSFRLQVRRIAEQNLGRMKRDADEFIKDLTSRIKSNSGLVVLVDSLDHADNRSEFETLMTSIQRLFERHGSLLQLAGLHIVYTVPPYLRFIHTPCGPVRMLTTVKVAERDGAVVEVGVQALIDLIDRRDSEWHRLLGSREVLERLILLSGGHIRDLLRMVASVAMHARSLPADPDVIEYAINQYRNSLVADLADDEIAWLNEVAKSHDTGMASADRRGAFASLLDRHLVLGYLNGEEWYDVHPLARPVIGLDDRYPPPSNGGE